MKTKTNRKSKVIYILFISFVVIALLSPLLFILLLNYGNPYTQFILNKKLPPYLEQRGYSDEDILEEHTIEPKYIINRDYDHAHYEVTFEDEPNVSYFYGIKKRGKSIEQFCEKEVLVEGITTTNTGQTKHSEEKCVSMFANRD